MIPPAMNIDFNVLVQLIHDMREIGQGPLEYNLVFALLPRIHMF